MPDHHKSFYTNSATRIKCVLRLHIAYAEPLRIDTQSIHASKAPRDNATLVSFFREIPAHYKY